MFKDYNQIVAYINGNLGDDLFVKILCERYQNQLFVLCGPGKYKKIFKNIPNLKYFSEDTLPIKIVYKLVSIVRKFAKFPYIYRNKLLINMISKRVKCNILITGSYFVENPYRLYEAKMERKFYESKPYIINCNFGPYTSDEFYSLFYEYFSMTKWTSFRDKKSYDLFNKLNNVSYAPDIACSIDVRNKKNKGYVVISVMDFSTIMDGCWKEIADKYLDKMVEIIQYHLAKKQQIYLMSFCEAQGDLNVAKNLFNKINNENVIVWDYEEYEMDKSIQLLTESDLIYASRFHSMMLGIILGKKVVPFCYSNKMENVLSDLNYDSNLYQADIMLNKKVEDYQESYVLLSSKEIESLRLQAENHFIALDKELNRSNK